MTITFKQFLCESEKNIHKLANRLDVPVSELTNMDSVKLHTLLKTVGRHDFTPDSEFNAKELKRGISVESEHTTSKLVAKLIAKDHLEEIPDYYTRLDKMEKEAK